MEELEATFYLDGQAYVYDPAIAGGGPELIERALFETHRRLWFTFGQWAGGYLTGEERMRQFSELYLGVWALRDLLPHDDPMFPQAPLVTSH